jgi:moderate conductance mechanosensitive channel
MPRLSAKMQAYLRKRKHSSFQKMILTIAIVVAIAFFAAPVRAQLPFLPNFQPSSDWLVQNSDNLVVSECVHLDGRCLFKVASAKADISQRVGAIEQRLAQINSLYLRNSQDQLRVEKRIENNLPNIYVIVGDREIRLLNITSLDVQREGIDFDTKAEQIIEQLEIGLPKAKQERQPDSLLRQSLIAIALLSVMFLATWLFARSIHRFKQSKKQISPVIRYSNRQPITTQCIQRQQWNLKEVQLRLLQFSQVGIWIAGILLILGLFPQTRIAQVLIFTSLKIPLRVGLVIAVTYVCIRLSYALIAKFNSILASNALLSSGGDRRVLLRVNTFSVVARGIITIILVGVGCLVSLSEIGVDITPILAGVGILGVAFSLASQNLIKDAINGFFIILEDQYAVGDVIDVAGTGGLVENMNLRITQLRDAEGRLITIPNSEIKIVANLSSHWSRADITIPVAYQADVDKALELIDRVAQQMSEDEIWREHILESPQVLGIDAFSDRGALVRVWIKTQPLKQWDVSREFRRRIKIQFEEAGMALPLPQMQAFINDR